MEIDKSVVLTDSVIDELLDDWFERDGDTFSKIRKRDRIGWEATLEEGEAYSAYLLEAPTQEDLIKRAYNLAKETIVVMDPPFKVKVKITTCGGGSHTDGKTVFINTAMFDDPELSVGEKLDTFLGVTVHEGCHLLYTDLGCLRDVGNYIVKNIWNILEDERIEMLCGEHKPGLANFLEKSKYYYFDHYYLQHVVPKEKEGTRSPFDRIMNCILHIVRYPKYLKEEEIIEFAYYLMEVKKVVFPFPLSSKQALETAKRIYEIIKDFYIETEKKEAKTEKEPKTDTDDKADTDDKVGADDKTHGCDSADTEEGISHEESEEELTRRALRKLEIDAVSSFKEMKDISGSPTSLSTLDGGGGGLRFDDLAEAVARDKGLLGEVCEGCVELGSGENSFFSKMEDKKEMYLASLSRIKGYIPAVSKILKGHCKEYKLIHRSMRSGYLDTSKLAEAYQGVPNVYLREGEVKTDKVSVCILIDESGSMMGKRIQAARDTAILINEAIGQVPNVELYIYGHSGDLRKSISTELFIYREKGYYPKYSLGSCKARSQNRDGVAIIETAKRVRKQTKNPVLFFILSDGEPCAEGYSGGSALNHVRDCVIQAERMGFSVIQVCINHTYDPKTMFKNYVIMENMDTLAIDLGKAIKKATMKASKVRVS